MYKRQLEDRQYVKWILEHKEGLAKASAAEPGTPEKVPKPVMMRWKMLGDLELTVPNLQEKLSGAHFSNGEVEGHLGGICADGIKIYESDDMKAGMDLEQLTKHQDLLCSFLRLDPRGGHFGNADGVQDDGVDVQDTGGEEAPGTDECKLRITNGHHLDVCIFAHGKGKDKAQILSLIHI